MRWTVLVPLRAMPNAKSRLAATVAPELFAGLVAAIRADTIAAARESAAVARVLVVGDEPGAGVDVVQHSAGLNGALRDGAQVARSRWPGDGVVALVGDLPALQAADLTAALDVAADHPAAFVADVEGTGTTLYAARPGAAFDPRFGAGSAARHAKIATALPAGAGLRQDVDTGPDLTAALQLGVGPATRVAIGPGTALTSSS